MYQVTMINRGTNEKNNKYNSIFSIPNDIVFI